MIFVIVKHIFINIIICHVLEWFYSPGLNETVMIFMEQINRKYIEMNCSNIDRYNGRYLYETS